MNRDSAVYMVQFFRHPVSCVIMAGGSVPSLKKAETLFESVNSLLAPDGVNILSMNRLTEIDENLSLLC